MEPQESAVNWKGLIILVAVLSAVVAGVFLYGPKDKVPTPVVNQPVTHGVMVHTQGGPFTIELTTEEYTAFVTRLARDDRFIKPDKSFDQWLNLDYVVGAAFAEVIDVEPMPSPVPEIIRRYQEQDDMIIHPDDIHPDDKEATVHPDYDVELTIQ
jgi:hypothetical protein